MKTTTSHLKPLLEKNSQPVSTETQSTPPSATQSKNYVNNTDAVHAWIRVFYLLTLQGIISKSTFDSRSNPSSSRRNQSKIYRFTLQGIIAKATVLLPKRAFSLGYYNCFSTLENFGSTHRSSDKNNRIKHPFPWSCHSLIVRSILLIFFVQILETNEQNTLLHIFQIRFKT